MMIGNSFISSRGGTLATKLNVWIKTLKADGSVSQKKKKGRNDRNGKYDM